MNEAAAGHAFISYVREDKDAMQAIASALRAADVPVWTDKDKLSPGVDWQVTIRKAIQRNSLAFIAVFSKHSEARDASYQNEELILAVDQFRQHPPGRVWMIPVRLDECELPEFDLGAGRTLNSLQRVDLFGDEAKDGKIRLVSAVLRILNDQTPDSATVRALVSQSDQEHRGPTLANAVKSMVLEPRRRIELEELITSVARQTREDLADPARFPESPHLVDNVETARAMVERFNQYWLTVEPLAHALATAGAWSEPDSLDIWTRATRAVASLVDGPKEGNDYLRAMQHYPLTLAVYAGALGAMARKNYAALRAIAVDPAARDNRARIPVVNVMQPYQYEHPFKVAANLLAYTSEGQTVTDEQVDAWKQRGGLRYTPISDHLLARLAPMMEALVSDFADYEDLFDETEVMLAVLSTDAYLKANEGVYMKRPWFGRFAWRYRHVEVPLHRRLQAECEAAGDGWHPLAGGLFGGSSARAIAAFESFGDDADQVVRRSHF